MTPISSLRPHEVTIELIALADRCGPDERRVLYFFATMKPEKSVSAGVLRDTLATLDDVEKRLQLAFARRVAGIGLDRYGPLDLASDRRNLVEAACEEDLDQACYRICDLLRGRDPGRLLGDGIDLTRRSVALAVKSGAL